MQEYLDLTSGHMEFLISALDGDVSGIEPSAVPGPPTKTDPELVKAAVAFLRRTNRRIEPNKQWPVGSVPEPGMKRRIPPEHRAEPGKSLCIWGDSGWGDLVRQGKNTDDHYSDELVADCAKLVSEWKPTPAPSWVTCIPSRLHPNLVPDFARRLANSLGLPFHEVLAKTGDRPAQKKMENSSQLARNVIGSLDLTGAIPDGAVLLVDDMVDSRWTLTVAVWLLRSQGSSEVFPLVLADTGRGG